MSSRLTLKRPTRRRLQKLDRKHPNADLRVRIRVVLKVASGLSCNAAAREAGCVPSTAVRGALLDRVHGYLADRFDTRRRLLLAA